MQPALTGFPRLGIAGLQTASLVGRVGPWRGLERKGIQIAPIAASCSASSSLILFCSVLL
jgi:hypothetical protein